MDNVNTTIHETIPDSDASEETDDTEQLRPNKWQGAPSTWSTLTAQERGLAASLDQIRNADLSLHLFNAHALKRRAREFEEDPERVKQEHPAVPAEDQTFEPPKSWTAWPLPPHRVPREGEHIGPQDPDEKFTYKRKEVFRPSRELEDIVLGLTLKFAKERFLSRDEAKEDDVQTIEETTDSQEDDNEGLDLESLGAQGEVPAIKRESAPPSVAKTLVPGVSIDDDRSRTVLRPSIRHTLSKLDEVLMALHHARKIASKFRDGGTSDFSAEEEVGEEDEDEESTSRQRRPVGRPRKLSDLPVRSRAPRTPSPHDLDDADLLRTKKTHLGRPLKVYDRVDGETQEEYLIRIATIQKKPLPAFTSPRKIKSETTPSRSRSRSRTPGLRATSEERRAQRRKRLNPRDWSEVMSAAALVGFAPDVIARATQRCANLFGEGMIMRNIVEKSFSEEVPGTETRYVPEAIPDFHEEILISSGDDETDSSDVSTSSQKQIKSERPNSRASMRSRIHPSLQTCFCPDMKCPRNQQGFKEKDDLRKHLKLAHQRTEEEIENHIIPSDDEMDGAVHVDGFLRPLKRLGGARGSYNKIAKKAKLEPESSDDDEDQHEDEHTEHSRRSNAAVTTTNNKEDGDVNGDEDEMDDEADLYTTEA